VLVLAELARGDASPGGAKFITLTNRLGISRASLTQTLNHLITHDYVMCNPGVGHPMRPEYLLAEDGYDIAPLCVALLRAVRSQPMQRIALKKWSFPVVLALDGRAMRFNELKAMMPIVTARALALALKDLASVGLVKRQIVSGYPPTTVYKLTQSAQALVPLLRRIASSRL
jgi:DNA-binding HxlR family transcriptional regulator